MALSGGADHPKCNEAGRTIIKDCEGLSLTAYVCPAGVLTIGYGHTRGVLPRMVITRAEAETMLEEDLEIFEAKIDELVNYELGSNEFSALCSFVYNIGTGNFARSAVLNAINNGDFHEVGDHMKAWKYGGGHVLGGLVHRRELEAELWERPDEQVEDNKLLVS